LVCGILLSMLGLWCCLEGREAKGFWLFYMGCGLGALVKGPLGVALPLASLAGYVLLTRSFGLILKMRPLRGIAVLLAIIGLWAVPAAVSTQGAYFYELVWIRSLRPVFQPLQGHGGGDLWGYLALLPFYVPVVVVGFGPFAVFFGSAFGWLKAVGFQERRSAFLTGWILSQFILFSLVSTKLAHYVLPFFPALALLVGAALDARMDGLKADGERPFAGPTAKKILVGAGFILAGALIAAPLVLGVPGGLVGFLLTGLATLGCTIRIASALRESRPGIAISSMAGSVFLVTALLSLLSLPSLDEGKSAADIADFQRIATERRIWRKSVSAFGSTGRSPSRFTWTGQWKR